MAAAALPIPEVVVPEPTSAPSGPGERSRSPVTRTRQVTRRRQASPFRRAILMTGLPVAILVLYVGVWAAAMRGGYYKNRLANRIRTLEVENASLQAEVRRLAAPGRVFQEASALGMERPVDVKFVTVPKRHD